MTACTMQRCALTCLSRASACSATTAAAGAGGTDRQRAGRPAEAFCGPEAALERPWSSARAACSALKARSSDRDRLECLQFLTDVVPCICGTLVSIKDMKHVAQVKRFQVGRHVDHPYARHHTLWPVSQTPGLLTINLMTARRMRCFSG